MFLLAEKIQGGVACHGFENIAKMLQNELKEGDIIYVPQAVHVTTNVFEQMMSGNMPNMGTGMPNMGASRPSGNMGGMSGSRPSGNMGGGMR